MPKNTVLRLITAILLIAAMAAGITGCGSYASNNAAANGNQSGTVNQNGNAAPLAPAAETKNTATINVVWYPNESSNTHTDIRAEVARLIEQATGRKVENKTTTDYTIAIESIASGSADIAISMGAVGYIEAKNRNPEIDVLFVNSDKDWGLDGAKYFAWLCVDAGEADNYLAGGEYSIENIKGKKISFVSNSSTSGFRVPTSAIIAHFASDNLNEDDLIDGGRDNFFSEVFYGQSHQGSAINLITGLADVAAFCDIELQPYIELKSGDENTVGATYAVRVGADAPFNAHAGKEFTAIASIPVFNGPNAYNPKNLDADEVKAIQDLFTSEEVAGNEIIFYDASVEGAVGLFKKSSSYGYVLADDSWYDPYR